jgi:hypothetical protein
LAVFSIIGGTVIAVYGVMNRDATLSHIANTRPGDLGGQFCLPLITFGIGPLLGLLTTLIPVNNRLPHVLAIHDQTRVLLNRLKNKSITVGRLSL